MTAHAFAAAVRKVVECVSSDCANMSVASPCAATTTAKKQTSDNATVAQNCFHADKQAEDFSNSASGSLPVIFRAGSDDLTDGFSARIAGSFQVVI